MRKLRVGVSAALPVTAGFWDAGVTLYHETSHNSIVGRDVTFKTVPELTTAWTIPVGGVATFSGYAYVIAARGKDGFGADTKAE